MERNFGSLAAAARIAASALFKPKQSKRAPA